LRVPKREAILPEAMPIYEYRCEQGHTFEVMQRMSDDPVQTCETCEAPVARVFHPVAVHFKGSGFYNTDYGTRKRARESSETKKSESSSSDSGTKSDSGSSSSSDSKSSTESKSTTSKSSD
jgi:putative FmdB family regulatory protein